MKKKLLILTMILGFVNFNYSQIKTFPDTTITCSQSLQLGLITPTSLEVKGGNWKVTVNLSIYDASTSTTVYSLSTVDFSKYPNQTYKVTLNLKGGNYIAKYDDWRPDISYLTVTPQKGTASSNKGGNFFVDNPVNISTSKFSWSPNLSIDDSTKYNPIVNPTQTTNYILKIKQADNSVSYDTIKVIVKPLKISAGIDKNANCWDTTSLSAENLYLYIKSSEVSWSIYNKNTNKLILNGTGNVNSNLYFQSGDYKLKIINNGPATFDYNIKPLIGTGTGVNTNVSVGQGDSIISYFSVSDIGLQLKWSPIESITSEIGYLTKVLPRITTNYYLTGNTSNGCMSKDTVKVIVSPLSVSSPDKSLICGGKVQFDNPTTNYTGSGALTYVWLPSAGIDNAAIARPTAEITTNTNFALQVSTPNGCVAEDTVKVTVNPLTVNTGEDKSIICGGNVQFNNPITNYTGTGTLTYAWLPSAGLDNAAIASPTSEVTTNTDFALAVSTPNGCVAKDTVKVSVNPLTATANDITFSCGNTAQLNVTTNYTGSSSLSYSWSPSLGLSATNIANPSATLKTLNRYSVEVKTLSGCGAIANVNVNPSVIGFNPSICMVTVNDSDKNVIVWQRENNSAIDSFFIFRESSSQTDQYDLIGKLSFAARGVFVDTLSNARVQSNKYKIATKDVCGFLTDKSSEHKTMHLTINKGIGNKWNLIWEQYVGLTVSSYKIYRGTTKANMVEIGSSAGGNTTYTDETASTGDVYYQIGVVLPQACTNLKSTGYESSRSNIMSSADAVTGIANTSITETFIYPNPTFDKLNILNTYSANSTIMIFDLQGKQVLNKQVVNGQVDISSLSKGIYTVRLIDTGNIMINKIVKQ